MTLTLPPPQKSLMPRKTVKTSVSPYKERGEEKWLLIPRRYKTNVKHIKLYQISHSSNKGRGQRILTEARLSGKRTAELRRGGCGRARDAAQRRGAAEN